MLKTKNPETQLLLQELKHLKNITGMERVYLQRAIELQAKEYDTKYGLLRQEAEDIKTTGKEYVLNAVYKVEHKSLIEKEEALNKAMAEKNEALNKALTEKTEALYKTITEKADAINKESDYKLAEINKKIEPLTKLVYIGLGLVLALELALKFFI